MKKPEFLCEKCSKPVDVNREQYDVFEKMHWLCFHLEFEHDGDPDQACGDPNCPWWHIDVLTRELERLGRDPQFVIESAIKERWKL